jgi:hypothetical protein
MAEMQLTEEDVITNAGRFERPIPGQSLTNDPDSPLPFEGPVEFTDQEDVLNYYFELLTAEDKFEDVMDLLEDGTPVMDLVQILLMQGFQEGLFNPDLMLIMAEPLAYLLIALAERQGIDVEIMSEEDEEGTTDTSMPTFKAAMNSVEPTSEVPEEIAQQVDNRPSLLSKEEV